MIQAVTFDFWQTLMADTPENMARATALRIDGVKAVLGRSGYSVERELIQAAYDASARRLGAVWREYRDLSFREQVAVFLDTVTPALSSRLAPEAFEEAAQAYISPVLSYSPVPSPGALEAVDRLARLGLVLCIVSNTGRTPGVILRQVLSRFGLLEHFRVTSFSDEVGVRKPRPEIFQVTLAQAGVDPTGAVHVGDMPNADVAGATAAGMRAVHYAPEGRFRPGSDAAHLVIQHLATLPQALTRLS